MLERRGFLGLAGGSLLAAACGEDARQSSRRPNILFVISDDQSYPHTSIYGFPAVQTPAFDRVAREGVLFHNGFGASPGCSPCRAAMLTGRHTWMIENAGTHASSFPVKYVTFPDLLEKAGYWVGFTGKGWGPGNWKDDRPRNPAGPEFNEIEVETEVRGIAAHDYAANFEAFLAKRPAGAPFCFWVGGKEPHRVFEKGRGLALGKKLEDAPPPPFLPDRPEIREDILDYAAEIEYFDGHVGRILDSLQKAGELDSTLVIVTSDNGMAFRRAKANCYEYGTHMPLAIRWADRVPGGREVQDLVGFVDLTATILEAAGVTPPAEAPGLAGKSIYALLTGGGSGLVEPERDAVYFARERHSSARYRNWGYPQRALRTHDYLYVRNFAPDRYPSGDPQKFDEPGKLGPMHGGYHDIDDSPSLRFLVENRNDPEIRPFFELTMKKRPAEELFDIRKDPGCLRNLAGDPAFEPTRAKLAKRLEDYLRETGDARVTGDGEVWETYKRYSPLREFPEPPAELPG